MSEKKKKGGERLDRAEKQKETQKPSTEKAALTPRQRILRRVLIVLAAIAAVIVVLFVVYRLWAREPDIPDVSTNTPAVGESDAPVGVTGHRKKQVYTFLLFGKDTGGGGNTDTMMLATYDVPNQKIAVMSLPRDTMVNAPWDLKKLNAVYNFAPYYDRESVDYMKEYVGELVGFRPDYSVAVEWEAFGKLVDAVGGVDFDVPRNMNYNDPTQNLSIHINKGMQHLNGEQAMGVVRYRHDNVHNGVMPGYANGDLGRVETQQKLLAALMKKCLTLTNIATKYQEYLKIFNENVTTDLSMGNLAWFAEQILLGGFKTENLTFCSMPNNGAPWRTRSSGTQSFVTPKTDELLELINANFNPYQHEVTQKMVNHIYVDSNGRLGATTGIVRDKKAATAQGNVNGSGSSGGSNTPKPTKKPEGTLAP
ncbi:MAG: LCP family protein, partial [Oscillospiraceae bacterium]